MSNLLTLNNVSLAYGLDPLLDQANFQIEKGERVCLVGRNGAGKSSLFKLIDGTVLPDSGSVWIKPGLRLARLTQDLPADLFITVYEFVAQGLAEAGNLLSTYHHAANEVAHDPSNQALAKLEKLQAQLDAINGWQFDQNINTILTRLDLSPDKKLGELSGGWQRRAALAKALVASPELLLLDEPTNHLDMEAIEWLENYLLASDTTLFFITHDRALLQRLATRIIELDRGHLTSWPGDYKNFLFLKEEALRAEAKHHAEFDKKLAEEERWIRQGIKARRTRNEGRMRALKAMRVERSKRRNVQGNASFSLNTANQSGQLVVEATGINQQFNGKYVARNFSIRIMRGDRIGLIGPNGIGKSTLLNILLGKLTPEHGEVKIGTNLQVAYFDQKRQALDLEKTVIDNVISGKDTIEINGKSKHIMSYLSDFLFTPQRALTPVKALSGGECNRLLLARLFSQPANLLVMDEPTNDLDIETLELLEELLADYKGTLLIVSHDREFLDNVVTSSLVFTGEGEIQEYVGGYQDYLAQRTSIPIVEKENKKNQEAKVSRSAKKLSFKEQKELDALPKKIEQLEANKQLLTEKIAQPDFYKQDQTAILKGLEELKALEAQLQNAYSRWEELEQLQDSLRK